MSSSHSTLTRHAERMAHDTGNLNTEAQFRFSSVRLKFKTGTPMTLVSVTAMTHATGGEWLLVSTPH